MAKRIRGKNEGSISKRSNGRWRAQVSPVNGRRISRDFKTKPEAQVWLRQMQGDLEQGFDYQGSKTLLKDYLDKWLEISRTALRPKTAHDYERNLRKHVLPQLGEVTLKDLTPFKMEKFYAQLIEAGVGVRTVRLIHSILHRALEKAVIHGLLTRNPTAHATLPRYKHGEMQVLDEMQVNQFLVAAIGSPFEALYHLAVKTGMRQGELFGLKWSDLKPGNGLLYVRRQVQSVPARDAFFRSQRHARVVDLSS
jgi:integrase